MLARSHAALHALLRQLGLNAALTRQQVACTDRNYPPNAMRVQPHRQLLENMTRSNFCLMLPGNSQSSQRLTEAFLTGCIPVFVGPPWHSLPLTQLVRLLRKYCSSGMTALKPSKAPRSRARLCPRLTTARWACS